MAAKTYMYISTHANSESREKVFVETFAATHFLDNYKVKFDDFEVNPVY